MGSIEIDNTPASIAVQRKNITHWTIEDKDQVQEINLGSAEKPNNVRICKNLEAIFQKDLIELLREYKDVFAWSFEDLKGIPPHICKHRIELIPHAYQSNMLCIA